MTCVTGTLDEPELFSQAVIVTGGDSGYAHLIEDLLASVRSFPEMDKTEIVVLDGGLTETQQDHFKQSYRAKIFKPEWEYKFSSWRIRGREHLKTQLCRAFLDKYVGDSQIILWIDADAWIHDLEGVRWLLSSANRGNLAVVGQVSRYSAPIIPVRWRFWGMAQIRTILYKNARKAGVKEKEARAIGLLQTLNSGVFALHRKAPHWQAWRDKQAQVLKGGARIFSSDQLSLAMGVYLNNLPLELMPEHCNYCGPWLVSADGKKLLEAYAPYHPATIVHMAGRNDQRSLIAAPIKISKIGGGEVETTLRFGSWSKRA